MKTKLFNLAQRLKQNYKYGIEYYKKHLHAKTKVAVHLVAWFLLGTVTYGIVIVLIYGKTEGLHYINKIKEFLVFFLGIWFSGTIEWYTRWREESPFVYRLRAARSAIKIIRNAPLPDILQPYQQRFNELHNTWKFDIFMWPIFFVYPPLVMLVARGVYHLGKQIYFILKNIFLFFKATSIYEIRKIIYRYFLELLAIFRAIKFTIKTIDNPFYNNLINYIIKIKKYSNLNKILQLWILVMNFFINSIDIFLFVTLKVIPSVSNSLVQAVRRLIEILSNNSIYLFSINKIMHAIKHFLIYVNKHLFDNNKHVSTIGKNLLNSTKSITIPTIFSKWRHSMCQLIIKIAIKLYNLIILRPCHFIMIIIRNALSKSYNTLRTLLYDLVHEPQSSIKKIYKISRLVIARLFTIIYIFLCISLVILFFLYLLIFVF